MEYPGPDVSDHRPASRVQVSAGGQVVHTVSWRLGWVWCVDQCIAVTTLDDLMVEWDALCNGMFAGPTIHIAGPARDRTVFIWSWVRGYTSVIFFGSIDICNRACSGYDHHPRRYSFARQL